MQAYMELCVCMCVVICSSDCVGSPMASLTLLVLLLSCLFSCGHFRYINGHSNYHVKRLLLSRLQRQANAWEPSSVDERRRYRPAYLNTATERADTEAGESEQETALPAKRLVGLFRCSGWGPSCSRIDQGEWNSRLRQPSQRSYNVAVDVVGGKATRTTARNDRPRIKFEPFFTLTSGIPTPTINSLFRPYCS